MSAADNEHPPANEEDSEPTAAEKAQMEMRRRIMKIMMDTTLSDAEKAQKRQDLMSGKWSDEQEDKPGELNRLAGCAALLTVRVFMCSEPTKHILARAKAKAAAMLKVLLTQG
jgi:hypothetical protein